MRRSLETTCKYKPFICVDSTNKIKAVCRRIVVVEHTRFIKLTHRISAMGNTAVNARELHEWNSPDLLNQTGLPHWAKYRKYIHRVSKHLNSAHYILETNCCPRVSNTYSSSSNTFSSIRQTNFALSLTLQCWDGVPFMYICSCTNIQQYVELIGWDACKHSTPWNFM